MSDWIEWVGGECPVDGDTIVEVKLKDGRVGVDEAGKLAWSLTNTPRDIFKYRIIKEQSKMEKFGDLTKEEQVELVVACYVEKKDVEKLSGSYWYYIRNPAFDPDDIYRVKPEPASINWAHVDERFVKLEWALDTWWLADSSEVGFRRVADIFSSFKPGDKSITVYRPGHDGAVG